MTAAAPAPPALPWMDPAWAELGVREIRGGENPRIMAYHEVVDPGARWLDEDEDPWCASFASWCLVQGGVDSPRTARARAFLEYGAPLVGPQLGCIVVLRRGRNPAQGHVGFWLGQGGTLVSLLSGNDGDQVRTRDFPLEDVLGWRWPTLDGRPWAPD